MGMMRNAAAYLHQLQALLPLGFAWPREQDAVLTRFLDAASEEFARIDSRIGQLVDEADPRTTSELLPDWERVAGLPDNCSGELRSTVGARRQDLVSKLTSTGGQSPAYFIAVALALGYSIEIEEPKPFRVGDSCVGDPVYDDAWHHAWVVHSPDTTINFFTVGSSVGEPLAWWGNDSLECRLRQLKPAHTTVVFGYGGYEFGALLTMEGGALLTLGDDSLGILLEERL